jgi:diguanylate cyclase (GGDEF)-like protein
MLVMLVFQEPSLLRIQSVNLVTDAVIALASLWLSLALLGLLRRPGRSTRIFLVMFCTYLTAIAFAFLLRVFPAQPFWMLEMNAVLQEVAAMTGFGAAVLLMAVLPGLVRTPDPNSDGLTGLPNRMRFDERLEQALNTERIDPTYHCAVLFIDLDGFKLVNDDLGHAVGDELLRAVARRLKRVVRSRDLVARYGGDEFTVLLDRVPDLDFAEKAAKRIIETVQEPFSINNQGVRVGASIGIVTSSGKSNARQIIGAADQAMYRAKTTRPGSYEVWNVAPVFTK